MGRKFDSPEVKRTIETSAYSIVEAVNNDAWVMVNGEAISPQEISSHILRYIKSFVSEQLGEDVVKAVITVPAHFNVLGTKRARSFGLVLQELS